MTDLVRDNPWVAWFALAVVLAVLEMLSLELVLLMLALAAVVAGLASALGAPVWLSILLFALVAAALLGFARPPVVARLHRGPTLQTGHANLVGRLAVVLEDVDARGGRVQLASELWSARALRHDAHYPRDAEVLVVAIEGATAVVSDTTAGTDT